jgi:hypothetical protein
VEIEEGDNGEWEVNAALTNACEMESLFVSKEEKTGKNHWMNSIEEVLVLDGTIIIKSILRCLFVLVRCVSHS